MEPDTIYKLVDNNAQLVEAVDNENKAEIDNKIKINWIFGLIKFLI